MLLTGPQLTALAANINTRNATPPWTPSNAVTLHDAQAIANFYNGVASNPTVNVWRNNVMEREIKSAIAWQAFIGLTALQQGTYMAIVHDGIIDASDKGLMHGLVGQFGQTPPTDGVFVDASASSANIRAACIRPATFLEALFSAVGAGTLSTSNVCSLDANGVAIFNQKLDAGTVVKAMGW